MNYACLINNLLTSIYITHYNCTFKHYLFCEECKKTQVFTNWKISNILYLVISLRNYLCYYKFDSLFYYKSYKKLTV